ncbi:MAG: dCTP deaminase, partial [Methanoregula sp.]
QVPPDVDGRRKCRSSVGCRGVLLGAGFVAPGFRGQLTICLTHMGSEDASNRPNDRIVQLILHEVANSSEGYSGRYQDSVGAVEAR